MSGVVAICMPERGHVQRLLPVLRGLVGRGREVRVMSDAAYAADFERTGAGFVDLFARHPADAADASSTPRGTRWVTYAGVYAERVAEDVASLDPELIVYDTFALIASVVARRLSIPYVNVCSGHASIPSRIVPALEADPRYRASRECRAAIRRLREVHGVRDAHRFSQFDNASPFLNVYCEPRQFLSEEEAEAFQPIAWFGSLEPEERDAASTGRPFGARSGGLRVYVSFGTVIWRYFAEEALAALEVVVDVLGQRGADVLVSLGGHELGARERARLERPGVRVASYVDQWAVLRDAELFVTHHGLNSTHEAIYHRVPMLSYPFFVDQPGMARTAQALGLALPLADALRGPIRPDALRAAVERVERERDAFAARLERARGWELETIAGRGAVVDRMLALADGRERRGPAHGVADRTGRRGRPTSRADRSGCP